MLSTTKSIVICEYVISVRMETVIIHGRLCCLQKRI